MGRKVWDEGCQGKNVAELGPRKELEQKGCRIGI